MANVTTCTDLQFANTPACSAIMSLFCSSDTPGVGGQTYLEKWQGDEITSPCRKFVALNLGNQAQYVPVVDAYVRRYLLTERKAISYPQQGSTLYDPAIEDVVKVCQSYPGACDNTLSAVCRGTTRQELGANPNLSRLCGCFLSDEEFAKEGGAFGVTRECASTCIIQAAVKPRDPNNQRAFLKCKQSICIIDDVTINILGKSNAGDISFNQSCGSCGDSSSCVCSISDVSITAVESTIKDTSFSQQCGGADKIRCFKKDINGVPQSVPCTNLESNAPPTTQTTSITAARLRLGLIVGIIGIILLVIIIVIIILIVRRNQPSFYRPSSTTFLPSPPPAYYPLPYDGYPRSNFGGGGLSRAPLI